MGTLCERLLVELQRTVDPEVHICYGECTSPISCHMAGKAPSDHTLDLYLLVTLHNYRVP